MSLTHAVCAIADRSGYAIDPDDLNAALGLSWMSIAVPGEPNPAFWPLYARDAFLVEACRLFGMTIRDIHPPEAARGLSSAAEFTQHFDASYRPLVLRALEHDQPVLAWQGWPGEMRMLWGIITGTTNAGIGLRGRAAWPGGARSDRAPEVVTLDHPPVQLYVVEAVAATQPDAHELLNLALEHARKVLNDALHDRFGVITGPAAYDAWIEHSKDVGRAPPAEGAAVQPADVDIGRAPPADPSRRAQPDLLAAEGHRRLVSYVMAMHLSAYRFLSRLRPRISQPATTPLAELEKACKDLIRALGERTDPAQAEADASERRSQDRFVEVLGQARDLTVAMRDTLGAA